MTVRVPRFVACSQEVSSIADRTFGGGVVRLVSVVRKWSIAGAVVAALAGCDDAGGDRAAQQAAAPPPVAVGFMTAAQVEITPATEFVGRVEAVDQVDIRARVQGFLNERLFEEGADVKVGDLLFRIEPERYEAAVAQAEAALASAQAKQQNTAAQLARGEQLLRNKNIAQAQVDILAAEDAMAKAAILEAQAALQDARINLGYTEIRAPISGRIGASAFTTGALVGPDTGPLATIVSQDPIDVTFPVSQRQILEIRKAGGGENVRERVDVRVRLADGTLHQDKGVIDFADIRVDPGTDTLLIRARLPNSGRVLIPGQFATVVVESRETQQAIVIPQSALLIDQAGPYVLIVDGEGKAQVRRVTTGTPQGPGMEIKNGLEAGDRVIVEGVQRVRPGAPVTASEVARPAAGA